MAATRAGVVCAWLLLALCRQTEPAAAPIPHVRRASAPVLGFQVPFDSARRRLVSALGRARPRGPVAALVDPAASDSPQWQQFADWASARGIRCEKWRIGDVGGGLRGAIATENVREGAVLVAAPPEAVLSVREGDACPLPRSFIDPAYWDSMAKKWEVRMALLLLYEQSLGAQSAWAAYLGVLPQTLGLPLTFSEEEVQELQYPAFIADVQIERKFWEQQFEALGSAMAIAPSRADFYWALSCACSRTATFTFGGNGSQAQVMFPAADMFNHDSSAAAAFRFSAASGCFELAAARATPSGRQLVISYGAGSNSQQLPL